MIESTKSSFHNTITIAEGETSSKFLPFNFEPVSDSNYNDQDISSSHSETNIGEQASLTEQLGSTSWCDCTKCTHMPSGIKCQC